MQNDFVVGRLIPLGTRLQPPRLVSTEPPTVKSILAALVEPADALETIATDLIASIRSNDGMRCAEPLDAYTQGATRNALLSEFALATEAAAHLRGLIATGQEVLGW